VAGGKGMEGLWVGAGPASGVAPVFVASVSACRRRWEEAGFVLREQATVDESIIIGEPDKVQDGLRPLAAYLPQMEAAAEILESWVRNPGGVQRFMPGAAGCGKSYVKKFVVRTARDARFKELVLAVATQVTHDDKQGEGWTMASFCTGRISGAMLTKGVSRWGMRIL
jgi:hypothetical protein